MGKVRAFLEARNVEQLRRDCAVMGAAFRLPPFVNSTSTKLRHTGAGAGEKAGAGADEKADPESHLGVTVAAHASTLIIEALGFILLYKCRHMLGAPIEAIAAYAHEMLLDLADNNAFLKWTLNSIGIGKNTFGLLLEVLDNVWEKKCGTGEKFRQSHLENFAVEALAGESFMNCPEFARYIGKFYDKAAERTSELAGAAANRVWLERGMLLRPAVAAGRGILSVHSGIAETMYGIIFPYLAGGGDGADGDDGDDGGGGDDDGGGGAAAGAGGAAGAAGAAGADDSETWTLLNKADVDKKSVGGRRVTIPVLKRTMDRMSISYGPRWRRADLVRQLKDKWRDG